MGAARGGELVSDEQPLLEPHAQRQRASVSGRPAQEDEQCGGNRPTSRSMEAATRAPSTDRVAAARLRAGRTAQLDDDDGLRCA